MAELKVTCTLLRREDGKRYELDKLPEKQRRELSILANDKALYSLGYVRKK